MGDLGKLVATGIAALAIGTCAVGGHCARDTYQVQIVGAERVNKTDSSEYRVYTIDQSNGKERSFVNEDSLLEGKFDSADLQTKLLAAKYLGQTCDVKAYGFRIPLISSFENIVEVHCYDTSPEAK